MSESPVEAPAPKRSRLEARADVIRQRLVERLDALRERKRVLLDPVEEARRHPTMTIVAGGTLALLAGTSAAVISYRWSTRTERARRARLDAWKRLLTHPEQVAPRRPGLLVALLEKGVTAALGAAVATLAKRYLTKELAK